MQIYLQNLWVKFGCHGHRFKVKVTGAKSASVYLIRVWSAFSERQSCSTVINYLLFYIRQGFGEGTILKYVFLKVQTAWRRRSESILLIADMRPGNCYLELRDDTRSRNIICETALASNLTMKQCCCSVGLGWNAIEDERRRRPCIACPRYGSRTNPRLILGDTRQIRVLQEWLIISHFFRQ